MDDGTVIVTGTVLIVAIISIGINGIVQKLLDYKRHRNAAPAMPDRAGITQVLERTAHIEDRLKVLERIATDPEARRGAELASEIEQLRLEREKEPTP